MARDLFEAPVSNVQGVTGSEVSSETSEKSIRSARSNSAPPSTSGTHRRRQVQQNNRKTARYPPWLITFVKDRAAYLFVSRDAEEIPSVIREDLRRRGHKVSSSDVIRIIVGAYLAEQRARRNEQIHIEYARVAGEQAAAEVWEEAA